VLDDGSTDATAAVAAEAGRGDGRLEVVQDAVNRGKAARLNLGFERARHALVIVCDADTHMHPLAPKLLVARMLRSSLTAAVAGAPHVTNRVNLLCAMQVIEASACRFPRGCLLCGPSVAAGHAVRARSSTST
jgi:cellulose synthase/poly-beta-1,6-N-acetylglucosamine synthase-like glycosyltransferase